MQIIPKPQNFQTSKLPNLKLPISRYSVAHFLSSNIAINITGALHLFYHLFYETTKKTSIHQSTSIFNQSHSISHHSSLTTHLSPLISHHPSLISPSLPLSVSQSLSLPHQHPSSSSSSSSGSGISIFCFLTCIVFFFA